MYKTLSPFVFRMSPETAHNRTLQALRMAGSNWLGRTMLRLAFRPRTPATPVHAFGLTFANPVGLAAGYDKDGLGWRGLAELGFGHIEVGTVTTLPQAGTPQPRVFRMVDERAVINRMGFPNRGASHLVRRLQGPRPRGLILGVNIGKHIDTVLEDAAEDYLKLLRTFAPLADYLTINISSPNTPGLRNLQSRAALDGLLGPLATERSRLGRQLGRPVPLLVKLAPDLAPDELDDALDVILAHGMDGIIAANTTLRRPESRLSSGSERGGLSGAPITRLNTQFVQAVTSRTGGRIPVVASGGIMCPDDVQEKLDAGAKLIQLYTGLIFEGPALAKRIIEQCFPLRQASADRLNRPQPLPRSAPQASLTYYRDN